MDSSKPRHSRTPTLPYGYSNSSNGPHRIHHAGTGRLQTTSHIRACNLNVSYRRVGMWKKPTPRRFEPSCRTMIWAGVNCERRTVHAHAHGWITSWCTTRRDVRRITHDDIHMPRRGDRRSCSSLLHAGETRDDVWMRVKVTSKDSAA